MSISPVQGTVFALAPPNAVAAIRSIEGKPADAPLAAPNPRIEFDAKLGIAVLEYQNRTARIIAYYPEAARQDLDTTRWDFRA